MLAGVDDAAGNDAVFNDLAFVVNIFQEKIQRRDPLRQSALNFLPFRRRDDSGQQIVRKNPLRSLLASIDGESDSLVEKRLVGLVFAAPQFVRPQVQKQIVERTILLARVVRGAEHLVVGAIQFVAVKGFRTAGIGLSVSVIMMAAPLTPPE